MQAKTRATSTPSPRPSVQGAAHPDRNPGGNRPLVPTASPRTGATRTVLTFTNTNVHSSPTTNPIPKPKARPNSNTSVHTETTSRTQSKTGVLGSEKPTPSTVRPRSSSITDEAVHNIPKSLAKNSTRRSSEDLASDGHTYRPRWASSGLRSFEPVADETEDYKGRHIGATPPEKWALPSQATPSVALHPNGTRPSSPASIEFDRGATEEARSFLIQARSRIEASEKEAASKVLVMNDTQKDGFEHDLDHLDIEHPFSDRTSSKKGHQGDSRPSLGSISRKIPQLSSNPVINLGPDQLGPKFSHRPSSGGVRRSVLEKLDEKVREDAAIVIQRWFRQRLEMRKKQAKEAIRKQRQSLEKMKKDGMKESQVHTNKVVVQRPKDTQTLFRNDNTKKLEKENGNTGLVHHGNTSKGEKKALEVSTIAKHANGPLSKKPSPSTAKRSSRYSTNMAASIIQSAFRKWAEKQKRLRKFSSASYQRPPTGVHNSQARQPSPRPISSSTGTDIPSSGSKANDILSYLDDIEAQSSRQPKVIPRAGQDAHLLQLKIIDLEVELKEQKQLVQGLNTALRKQKDKEHEIIMKFTQQEKEKISILKEESESVISRHLGFIDQLLADKQELSQQCEDLASQLKSVDSRYSAKLQDLEEHFKKEMKKQKDAWTISEKSKREQLIAEKAKEIKETTIKGLEPEIQRMLTKHKQDIRKIEEKHEEDLKKALKELKETSEREMTFLRDRLGRDKEEALERERELSRQRLRELAERDEIQINELRRRITSDLNTERDQFEKERRIEKQRFEDTLLAMKKSEDERITNLMREHREAIEKLETANQVQISRVKEEHRVEKEVWQTQMLSKFDADLKNKEEQMRKQVAKERDIEIEKVIFKLEEEMTSSKSELIKNYEKKIQEIVSHNSAQLRQAQEEERDSRERCGKLVKELGDSQNRCSELERQIKELKSLISTKGEYSNQLLGDMEKLKAISEKKEKEIEDQFKRQLQIQMDTVKQLEKTIANEKEEKVRMEQSHTYDIDLIKQRQADELEKLNDRVRKTIQKKDEQIGQLQLQLQQTEARLQKTEMLLEKKRYDIFS